MDDMISRKAAIAEIEDYIEEYSELEPDTGYHNLKWCAMEEAKDVLTMLPAVAAIPVEWIIKWSNKRYRETQRDVSVVDMLAAWQKEQEAQR